MLGTQIQLPTEQYEDLRRVAASQRRSMADCIRERISLYLARSEPSTDELEAIAGTFAPMPSADRKAHDRQWVEAIMASKRPEPAFRP